jgi:hypothetical protein
MQSVPLSSVRAPVYKGEPFLEKAFDSLLPRCLKKSSRPRNTRNYFAKW